MEFEAFHLFQVLGILLIILGAMLFLVPTLLKRIPSLEKIPWILLYIYRKDTVLFVTSPILLLLALLSLLIEIIANSKR